MKFRYDWEAREKYFKMPFPLKEYESRVSKIKEEMEKRSMDCLLIYAGPKQSGNLRYISNFYSYVGNTILFLPLDGESVLVTDSIFREEPIQSGVWMTWIRDVKIASRSVAGKPEITDHVKKLIKERRLSDKTIGIVYEEYGLLPTYRGTRGLLEELQTSFPGCKFDNSSRLILEVKSEKSRLELDILEKVANIGDLGLEAAVEMIKPGVSEIEVAAEAYKAMFEEGLQDISYAPTSLVSGPRTFLKQDYPSNRKLQRGDMVYMDFHVEYEGYNNDLSRATVVGPPTQEQSSFLNAIVEIEEEMANATKPGVKILELKERTMKIAEETGFKDFYYFKGHGIGTHVVEIPFFEEEEQELKENMVFITEPIFVKPDLGTAAIENMVAVTNTGHERLSKYPTKIW
jgi:Xaa-Pro aminopeptidase